MPNVNDVSIAAPIAVNGLKLIQGDGPHVVKLISVDANGDPVGGAAFTFNKTDGKIYAFHLNGAGSDFMLNEQGQINIVEP